MKEMLQEYGRIIVSAIIIFIMIGLTVFFKGDYFINALSKLGVNTISYTLNGGTLPDDAVISYREYDEVVLPIPTNTKGTFEGWYETPDFTGEPVIKIEKGSTGDKTYYAKWNSESYAAVYGGTQLIFGIGAVPETYNGLELTKSWTGIETLKASSADAIPWKSYRKAITDVVVIDEIQPMNTAHWFYNFKNCSSMDLAKLDTSKVTNMSAMFYYAGYSTSAFDLIGVDNWDVSSVTTMYSMFSNAGFSATTFGLDLSGWKPSSCTTMENMFYRTGYKATTWSITGMDDWDVSSVTNMSMMFEDAGYSATTFALDLSGWNTSSVTNMNNVFKNTGYNSKNWTVGNLSGWDVSSVTTMYSMFSSAGFSATTFSLDLSGWKPSSCTTMNNMFYRTGSKATTWSITGMDDWDVSSVRNMSNMFNAAGYRATTFVLDLSGWNTSSVTNMGGMFASAGGCAKKWSIIGLDDWDVSSVTNMSQMFYSYEGRRAAKNWSIGDISGWDTSNVTNMWEMFRYAATGSTVLNLDLTGWNVDKVTSYANFNEAMTTKIKAPVWVN